ncbi:MAG: hypothetical protein ACYST3_03085 [Planctomycetota bacterium]
MTAAQFRMVVHTRSRKNYDASIGTLKDTISQAKMGNRERNRSD